MMNYTIAEEAAAMAANEKLTLKDMGGVVLFMMGFIVSTAALVGLSMFVNIL